MSFHVLGISHHSAPLEVREKLAFAPERQPEALAELVGQPGVAEAVLVSTCNRTEVYCRADDPTPARAWLCAAAERLGLDLDRHIYVHSGESAVRHAFRVAAGLDSMVLGEPQILGQVKHSVRVAEGAGTVGAQLGGSLGTPMTVVVAKPSELDRPLTLVRQVSPFHPGRALKRPAPTGRGGVTARPVGTVRGDPASPAVRARLDFTSGAVLGLSSVSARWIACTGRHSRKLYFASKHPTVASALATCTIASRRAVAPRSSCAAAAICRRLRFHCTAVCSAQKRAASSC